MFWTFVWTVSLQVVKTKDVREVSSHWLTSRIPCCIYGIVGEYIQLIFHLLTVMVSVLHLRVPSYTRNCFVLTAQGWIFHSQFLGVFQLAHIPKFSRLLKIPISCFRGFYSTFYALKLKITSHAFGRSRDWVHSIGCHSRRVCGFYVDIRSQYTFCISKHRQFSLYSFSIVLTLSIEIQE